MQSYKIKNHKINVILCVPCIIQAHHNHHFLFVLTLDGFELALEERYRRTLLEIDSLKEDLGESFTHCYSINITKLLFPWVLHCNCSKEHIYVPQTT